MGSVDALILRSAMTLFAEVASEAGDDFTDVLDKCQGGDEIG